jgi:predicted ArsR family transcriptional regulator
MLTATLNNQDLNLSLGSRMVLLTLASHADDGGKVCVPMRHLARSLTVSSNTIRRHLAKLLHARLLSVQHKGTGRTVSVYQFTVSNRSQL